MAAASASQYQHARDGLSPVVADPRAVCTRPQQARWLEDVNPTGVVVSTPSRDLNTPITRRRVVSSEEGVEPAQADDDARASECGRQSLK